MRSPPERLNRSLLLPGLAGAALVAAVGIVTYLFVPPARSGTGELIAATLGWLAIAALFGPGMAIEAVAHERLQTDAFDPLAGRQTRRLQVNLRYLQNTNEQFLLFAIALPAVAALGLGGERTGALVAALTLAWLTARYLFWIGYHRSSGLRVLGIIGLFIPPMMLLAAAATFAARQFGFSAGATVVAALLVIEILLFRNTRTSGQDE